jgi:hypothetical protein
MVSYATKISFESMSDQISDPDLDSDPSLTSNPDPNRKKLLQIHNTGVSDLKHFI